MNQYKYDVFISYSRLDTKIADSICAAFDSAGISYFIDRQGIGGGMEFPEVLAQAILDSNLFLFLASENSYKSKFTNSEITFAFNKKNKQSILPYIIDGSKMPLALEFVFSSINWRTLSTHPIDTVLVPDILALLGRNADMPQPIAQTEVHQISESTTEIKHTFHGGYHIDEDSCVACGTCEPECPVEAITYDDVKYVYQINPDLCIECGSCSAVCPNDCILE